MGIRLVDVIGDAISYSAVYQEAVPQLFVASREYVDKPRHCLLNH